MSPLYSGLFAALGTKLGFIGDDLWGHEPDFTDIIVGDNGLYHAAVGSDPCTGLGVPIGTRLAQLFAQTTAPSPTPTPTPTPSAPTFVDAIGWAASALPDERMSRHAVRHYVRRGLSTNWPVGASGVMLDQAIDWAESKLPHADMTLLGAKHHIAQGLRKHWPVGSP